MTDLNHFKINRTPAKLYFKGAGIFPKILFVVGIICFVLSLFSGRRDNVFDYLWWIAILASIIWRLVVYFSAGAYEREVDEIMKQDIDYLLNRGMEKLNIIKEQVALVEPIKTVGMSYQPLIVSDGKNSIIKKIKQFFVGGNNPVLISRADVTGRWRFSLNQINIIMAGEHQLYIYFAHLDITTGLIFHEGTQEYYYGDICAVATEHKLESKFNVKTHSFETVLFDFLSIYSSGCSHTLIFDSERTNSSFVQQIVALRNLIRDKKESKQALGV